jgi:integrase
MNHRVIAALDSVPRAITHDFVFTYKGQPITHKDSLKRSFQTACDKAKIPYGTKTPNGITFHDIRRTVKTNMLTAVVDKAHRDMILGHTLGGMDVHYLAPRRESH